VDRYQIFADPELILKMNERVYRIVTRGLILIAGPYVCVRLKLAGPYEYTDSQRRRRGIVPPPERLRRSRLLCDGIPSPPPPQSPGPHARRCLVPHPPSRTAFCRSVVLLLYSRAAAGCRRDDHWSSTPLPISFRQKARGPIECGRDSTRDTTVRSSLLEAEAFSRRWLR
jgi:hypothetical protein